jgi:hypothetical protein
MRDVITVLAAGLAMAALPACEGSSQAAASDPATQTTQSQIQAQSAATNSAPNGDAPPGHGPPPEAFDACQSKSVGDVCSVKFGDKDISGKCVSPPAGASDTRIVCRPDNMPDRPPPGPPPQEAFAACDGKATDAACTMTLGDKTLDGTCRPPPPGVSETRLACVPPIRPKGTDEAPHDDAAHAAYALCTRRGRCAEYRVG